MATFTDKYARGDRVIFRAHVYFKGPHTVANVKPPFYGFIVPAGMGSERVQFSEEDIEKKADDCK